MVRPALGEMAAARTPVARAGRSLMAAGTSHNRPTAPLTRSDAEGVASQAAELLNQQARPQGVHIGGGCQRRDALQQPLILPDLEVQLSPL